MIKLSVIIPVYNAERFLMRCVDSIINQPLQSIELILVNDGSKDGSLEICKQYVQMDVRIRLINKANGGVSSARNAGVEQSKGEYITFVDADDHIAPNTFTEAAFQSNADVIEFPYFGMANHTPHQKEHYSRNNAEVYQQMTLCMHNPCWARFYKRSVIGNIRFRENVRVGEDILFLIHIFPCINTYHLIPGVHGYEYYNDNPSSAMHVLNTVGDLDKLNAEILHTAQQCGNSLAWFYILRHCLVYSIRHHLLSTLLPKLKWHKLLFSPLPIKDKKELAVCKINYILRRIS